MSCIGLWSWSWNSISLWLASYPVMLIWVSWSRDALVLCPRDMDIVPTASRSSEIHIRTAEIEHTYLIPDCSSEIPCCSHLAQATCRFSFLQSRSGMKESVKRQEMTARCKPMLVSMDSKCPENSTRQYSCQIGEAVRSWPWKLQGYDWHSDTMPICHYVGHRPIKHRVHGCTHKFRDLISSLIAVCVDAYLSQFSSQWS
jgi:hypothetical protein